LEEGKRETRSWLLFRALRREKRRGFFFSARKYFLFSAREREKEGKKRRPFSLDQKREGGKVCYPPNSLEGGKER